MQTKERGENAQLPRSVQWTADPRLVRSAGEVERYGQEFRRLGYQVKIVERGMKSRGQGAGQQNNAVSDVLSAVRQQQWSADRSRPGVSHMPPSRPRTRQRHFRKTKVFILHSYG